MILTIYLSGLVATLLFLGYLQYKGHVIWDYIPISTFLLAAILWPIFWLLIFVARVRP